MDAESKTLSDFDPQADRFMDEPYAFYEQLRREAPVYREPRSGIYFIARYDLVETVMKNPQLFSSRVDRAAMRKDGLPERVLELKAQGWPLALTMSQNDEPSHDMYRALISHFFVPANLKAIQPFVEQRTEELFTAIEAKGRCDFLTEFAVPLPISVIGRYLGLEDYSYDTLKRWSDAFADEIGFLTSDARAVEIAELSLECHRVMIEMCEKRRAAPREDIISHLATARLEDGRMLDESELLSILTQLLVAGNETTTNTLAGGARRLAADPDLFTRLKTEPRLVINFVEEILRLESPVQGQFRKALEDTELGGVPIPRGALLHVRFASANRDEAIFGEQSDKLHLGTRHPKPHVAFGMGLHFCAGAMLSRLELRIAFQHMTERFKGAALAVPESELHYHTHFHLRGLKRLPLTFA